ncbi:MAG: PspC domain-containing protein [Oscillospiraceae bacterium]|nr:PspC domain-containing protein [Oscillospiraceae bacterium]
MGPRRIYKKRNGKLCGVCAGIGEYFNIDPVILRILFVVFAFAGAGILAYLICAIIMPYEDMV